MIPTVLDLLVAAAHLCSTTYTVVDYFTKTIRYFSILAIYQKPAISLDSFPADLIFDLHFPCPPMVTLIASAKEDHNKDRALPVELLSKIILMAHNISPLSPSIMRVNRNCHTIAQPLIYDTIRLNRHTLPKLILGLIPIGLQWSEDRCTVVRNYSIRAVKARVESRHRKLYSLQQATTLIIDDIPILFRSDFDDMRHEFCKYIVLPNVTKIIFCQEPNGPWSDEPIVNPREHWDSGAIRKRLSFGAWAALFSKVLPAVTKSVCVQIPPEGDFATLGNINFYNHDLPAHPVDCTFYGNKTHYVSTTDLIMQYIEEFSGTVNLRIHQDVLERRRLSHATIPATYVYRPFTPDPQSPGPIRVARTSGLTTLYHLAQFWQCDSERARQDIWNIYCPLMHSIDKPLDNHLPLIGQIALLQQFRVMESRSQKEAEAEFLKKVYQGVSAMHPDSTTPCPCCKEIGVPL
jgi:hypothetical protein